MRYRSDKPGNLCKHYTRFGAPGTKRACNRMMDVCVHVGTICLALAIATAFLSTGVAAQVTEKLATDNLEFSGGYSHVTGDNGLNGLNLGTALWVGQRFSLAADYDTVYNTSNVGVFALTSIGHTAVKSHLQNFLIGPRIFFPSHNFRKYRFEPLAELQFGISHLNTKIRQPGTSQSASDTAFSWMLGGGAEYQFDNHWSGRVKVDLLRTHFVDQGQSRLRLVLGVAYSISHRLPQ